MIEATKSDGTKVFADVETNTLNAEEVVTKGLNISGEDVDSDAITSNKYEDNPEALRDAGIAYAIDQIVDLITQGIDGIHLYTMNNPYIATRIHEAIKNLI